MARRINAINLEPGAACLHCDHVFERPYERVPEVETIGTAVLRCPHCGNYTVFTDPSFHGSLVTSHQSREPGED